MTSEQIASTSTYSIGKEADPERPADERVAEAKQELHKHGDRMLASKEHHKDLLLAFALDSDLFKTTFFPHTCRQKSPYFHREAWDVMERPENRYCDFAIFRDGAKTTNTRLFMAKRISYGMGWFTLFVSKSANHSYKSILWLKGNMEKNHKWTSFFGLKPSQPFTETELNIDHTLFDRQAHVIPIGITGQARGFNIADDRPDLIVGDDIDSEITVNTPEQREKTSDLVFSAIMRSLAPATDIPHAKFVLNQTPLHDEDVLSQCQRSPRFESRKFSCFKEDGTSQWPERYPTEELMKEKEAYVELNKLSLWLREMECEIVARETRSFQYEWLNYWYELPDGGFFVFALDPASSEDRDTDRQALVVYYFWEQRIYLVDYRLSQADEPEELWAHVVSLVATYRNVRMLVVETVAYQKILEKFFSRKMREGGLFIPIVPFNDRRKKEDRIIQAYKRAAYGLFFCRSDHSEFISEFCDHSPAGDHRYDDLLDAGAMAIESVYPEASGIVTYEDHITDMNHNKMRKPRLRNSAP